MMKKGHKRISIETIIPLLRRGYVAMDGKGDWFWYNKKPTRNNQLRHWIWEDEDEASSCINLGCFNIAKVKDWSKSLRRCGSQVNKEKSNV